MSILIVGRCKLIYILFMIALNFANHNGKSHNIGSVAVDIINYD